MLYKNLTASRTLFTFGETGCGAGGSYRFKNGDCPIIVIVSEFCNRRCFKLITHLTITALFAFRSFGGFLDGIPFTKTMSICGNDFLLHKNFVTNRAVFTFGFARCGTSCCYCLVDDLRVTKSRNSLLLYKNFATNIAVLAFGEARSGTGGGDCFVNNLGVTECGNDFLCYKSFVTFGAMLAFSKTGSGASRCYCFVNDFGMAKSIYVFLRYENFTASGAVLTLCKTCLGTSGIYCFVDNFGVTECGNGSLC